MIEMLLKYGADPSVQGWMKMSALDHADDVHVRQLLDAAVRANSGR